MVSNQYAQCQFDVGQTVFRILSRLLVEFPPLFVLPPQVVLSLKGVLSVNLEPVSQLGVKSIRKGVKD